MATATYMKDGMGPLTVNYLTGAAVAIKRELDTRISVRVSAAGMG